MTPYRTRIEQLEKELEQSKKEIIELEKENAKLLSSGTLEALNLPRFREAMTLREEMDQAERLSNRQATNLVESSSSQDQQQNPTGQDSK
jgi:hypothetical protein